MRKAFFDEFAKLAEKDKNIFLLIGDLGIKLIESFKKVEPERFINAGVAEANMIGVAAGMAMAGKKPCCYSIIPFLTMRALEQIRVDICYNNLDVKLFGAGGGLVYGKEGITHHAIEDIAIMRSLPNMTVVCPGDAIEAKSLAIAIADFKGPLYVRFGRDTDPVIHSGEIDFKIGKGISVKEGEDICLIATGTMLYPSTLLVDILKQKGLNPALISMPTVKPLDKELIFECAEKYNKIFTLEEHNILGGLGSAVAEVLSEKGFKGTFRRIGIPDAYSSFVGGPEFLLEKFNLTPERMAEFIFKNI